MILPSRRWFAGAALLALVAPLALVWPGAGTLLVVLDLLWLSALAVDGWRVWGVRAEDLDVQRATPPAFSVGRPLPVMYRWLVRLDRPVTVEVVEEMPGVLALEPDTTRRLTLRPGVPAQESFLAVPRRRGRGSDGTLHVRLLAPFGLAWRALPLPLPWNVTVYPRLLGASLRSLPSQVQRRREAGQRAVRRLGEGSVFESLREWVPGDDTRTIDWKATARRGKAMARQYEDERRQQVLIVIDAGRTMTAEVDGSARLESVVDAALQLAHAAVEHDDNVGLLVFNDVVQQWVAPARGTRALRAILDALAVVEGKLVEPDYPAAFATLAHRSRRRALTVIFTDVIDGAASEALVANIGSLRPRHLPVTVALRDPSLDRLATERPPTVAAAYERAAAEELLQAREAALLAMRGRGIVVLDVAPAGAAEAVVDQYELLKRRGAL